MTVRVIHKTESVIYKKQIYRGGDIFIVSNNIGESLIARGYVEKISDTPIFSDNFDDEPAFERIIIIDSANGDAYQLFILNGQAYIEKVGV